MPERTVEDIRKEWEKENNKPSNINLLVIKDDDRKIYISSFENDYVEHLELDNLAKDKRILELEVENKRLRQVEAEYKAECDTGEDLGG